MENNKITKGNKISIGGGNSLHSRIRSQEILEQSLPKQDPKEMEHRIAIICDFSGSMLSPDGTTKPKLELLKEGVQHFSMLSDSNSTAIAVESFPQGFRIELTNDNTEVYMRMLSARTLGDTPMASGMSNTLEYHSPTRCMLISDGEQTDGDAPFQVAQQFRDKSVVVDTFHIGSSKSGEETLKKIAEITGGMYFKFTDVTAFSENLHHLLPGSRETLAQLPESTRANLLGADTIK